MAITDHIERLKSGRSGAAHLERRRPSFSWISFTATVIALTSIPLISTLRFTRWSTVEEVAESTIVLSTTLLIGLVPALFVYPVIHLFRWIYYRFWETEGVKNELRQLQDDIQEDFFNNLVKINFKYIDKYYLQTQVQADKSFLLSSIAATVSLIVIIVGIVMLYTSRLDAAAITVGAGILGEFVASVFFYMYSQTVIKMSEYHQKLVLTQNISLALKISEELSDPSKSEARAKIIESLTTDINLYLTSSRKPEDGKAPKLHRQEERS